MRLQNKVIIVTGSTTGIGKAIAERCVGEGANVVLTGLEKQWGESVVAKLGSQNAVLHTGDITDKNMPKVLVDLALKTYGKLDAIVNNAAWITSSNIETTEGDYLRRVLEINTVAPLLLIREALPHLSTNRGSVVNI